MKQSVAELSHHLAKYDRDQNNFYEKTDQNFQKEANESVLYLATFLI
jgi:hypothetical protein